VRVSTAADTAKSEAVRRGNEFKMTATIAAANIAKRCQDSFVRPAGIGQHQMPSARAKGRARISCRRSKVMPVVICVGLHQTLQPSGQTGPGPLGWRSSRLLRRPPTQ
jgi:hypothetical protein